MENEILKKAKQILSEADSGSDACKYYNDGFLDGVQYALKALRQHPVMRCLCPNEIKTGTVAIHCCNVCGKPDQQ